MINGDYMNENILKQIKHCRKQRNMTLTDLSEKTGISAGYLSHLENGGRKNPSYDTLLKISKALDLDITFLFNNN